MPIRLERLPDVPILVVHSTQTDGDIATDTEETVRILAAALDAEAELVYLIIDLSTIRMDLADIMHSANVSARERSSVLRHPHIRQTGYVLTDGLIKMAVKGLESATFGRIKSPIFDTLDEAIAHYRGLVGPRPF